MNARRRQRGLTLLELVVVLFILSTIALGALAITNDADLQIRADNTRARLGAIRTAIVGGDDRLAAGWIADLGALPESIDALVHQPPALEAFGPKAPLFDADPTGGLDDGANVTPLAASAETLLKGWRGSYLRLLPGSDRFRDGFGTIDPTADDATHGWATDAPVSTITSLGADATPGAAGLSDYDADITETIVAADWQVDLGGWTVTVDNRSGATATGVRASILVYESGRWRRITTEDRKDIAAGAEDTLVFAATAGPIATGRHLLVLVSDPDATAHTADDAPFTAGAGRVITQVALRARADRPEARLVIR